MAELTHVKVALTPRNVSRLRNGHLVQLRKDQIGGSGLAATHTIKLSGVYAKKLTLATQKNVGTKIQLTKQEIEDSGLALAHRASRSDVTPSKGRRVALHSEAIPSKRRRVASHSEATPSKGGRVNIGKVLKTVGKVYRKNIRPVVGPTLKSAVTNAIKTALPAAAIALGQPELAPVAAAVANQIAGPAAASFGNLTGAYGLKSKRKVVLTSNRSTLIHSQHPAFHPALPLGDHSISRAIRGGSFRPA